MASISIKIKQSDSTEFVMQILHAMQAKGLIELDAEIRETAGMFTLEGTPISMEHLMKAIDEAETAFERGESFTTDQLRESVKGWK